VQNFHAILQKNVSSRAMDLLKSGRSTVRFMKQFMPLGRHSFVIGGCFAQFRASHALKNYKAASIKKFMENPSERHMKSLLLGT